MPDEPTQTVETTATNGATDWRSVLPEDLRAEKSLGEIKGTTWDEAGPLLAKGYVNAQKMIGAKLPEGVTAEQLGEYLKRKAEGAPESPDRYSIKSPVFPESDGVPWDAGAQAEFLAMAHQLDLPNAKAQKFIDWYAQYVQKANNAERSRAGAEREAGFNALQREWGSAWGSRLGNVKAFLGARFREHPDVLDMLETDPKAGNDPRFLRLWAELAEDALERGEIRGDQIGGGRTIEELDAEMERIREDPKNAGSIAAGERIMVLLNEKLRLEDRLNRK